jgi:glycosyltransferase involved in cell wall biosynthesis
MRIGILAEAFGGGGAERQAAIWATLLSKREHQVIAIETRLTEGAFTDDSVRHVVIPKSRPHDFIPVARALRRLEREVDVIVAFQPYLALCCALSGLRKPWMIVNGKVPSVLREGSRIPVWVYRWAFDRARLATAPCQGMVDSHRDFRIRPTRPWMVIPNIAADAAFVSSKSPRKGALFVGRLAAVKNPLLAVESAARAGIPLTLLGDGEMRGEIEARIAALNGADVTMLPYDRNPWPVYARHRVLLVTSEVESFGNVLVEALAAGTPVVSVDCDFGPREIIGGAKYSHLTSRSARQIGETLARVTGRPYGLDEEAECLAIAERYREQAVAPLIEEAVRNLVD